MSELILIFANHCKLLQIIEYEMRTITFHAIGQITNHLWHFNDFHT